MIPLNYQNGSILFYINNKEYYIKFANYNINCKIEIKSNYVFLINIWEGINIKYETTKDSIKERISIMDRNSLHKLNFQTNFDKSIKINNNYIVCDNKGEIHKNKVNIIVTSNNKNIKFNIVKLNKNNYPISVISQ